MPLTGRSKSKKERIRDAIEGVRTFRFCGPSDDPTVNLEMKRKAIEKAAAIHQKKRPSPWKKNPSILEWLESLKVRQ